MGRPRVSDERRIATVVRLPESTHRRLQLAANDHDVSANLLITTTIAEFLDRLPRADQVQATREGHDASAFYDRFVAPKISMDATINPPAEVDVIYQKTHAR